MGASTSTGGMLVAALRAHAVHERDAAERAAIFRRARREFARRHIDAARERDLHDIELVLEEGVDHLDHAFHGHRLLRDDEPGIGISLAKLVLERGAFHRVRGRAVLDAFILVDAENRRQERIVLAQHERVVEVFEHGPGRLLDFIAGENHVDARIDRIFHLDREGARMPVQIARFALKTVEAVGVLDVECCLGTHGVCPFFWCWLFRKRDDARRLNGGV